MLILHVVTAAWLLTAHADDLDEKPTDRIDVTTSGKGYTLSWHDAEDRLDGWIEPANLRAGHPLTVALRVGSFYGEEFKGPIQMSFREPGQQNGPTVTTTKGEVHWRATFTPEDEGEHRLDVVFRTTRMKSLHATIPIQPSMPFSLQQAGLIAFSIAGLLVIAWQLVKALRRKEPAPAPPAG
ncbi:MAG: hypothetical protein ACJ790_19995 [Myxococcaceae bacterium]